MLWMLCEVCGSHYNLTSLYIFIYALISTLAGQLPTLHAVRIHFPMDNSKKLLLTTYSVSSGLLLTPAGQPT
jgi:hypothetical protein